MNDYDLTYLSLGAGVQSSALLVMSALELHGCPKADVAIFADTQDEPAEVYAYLAVLQEWGAAHGLPVHTTTRGKLSDHLQDIVDGKTKTANIPAWTLGADGREAPLRRQCTQSFKIEPLQQYVRELLGYKPRQRIKHRVRCMLGISTDEAQRMKDGRVPWVTSCWPLIDAGLDRQACKELLAEHGLPEPAKSACVYCPYHDRDFWQRMKRDDPASWSEAVRVDEMIRDMSKIGVRSPVYLSRYLKPLAEIDFDSEQLEMFGDQFGNECEGMCGV